MERIDRSRVESVGDRVKRFERDFRPLTTYRARPVEDAIAASVLTDADASKERLAEWTRAGVPGRFWALLEQREILYTRSFPWMAWVGADLVLWMAVNDLCSDSGDVGVYARRYRAIREIGRASCRER